MTNLAWQVSEEDVRLALHTMGVSCDKALLERAMDAIQTADVERAALSSTDFDEQCALAQQEIQAQLRELVP